MGHGSVASNIPECATTDHIASDDKFSPLATMHIHNSTAFSELAQPYYGMAKMMKVCAIDAISQSCPHQNKILTANGSIPLASPSMTEYPSHVREAEEEVEEDVNGGGDHIG
nr:hypothetical protein Iba_chr04bCG12560 [Ipomoea batatas]